MTDAPTPKSLIDKATSLVWTIGLASLVLYVSVQLLRSIAVFLGIGVVVAAVVAACIQAFRRRRDQQW